jgi:hypothetical protein
MNLEPKPHFNIPLPVWAQITLLVVAVGGIVAIAVWSFL